jgi:hypothetical protein
MYHILCLELRMEFKETNSTPLSKYVSVGHFGT